MSRAVPAFVVAAALALSCTSSPTPTTTNECRLNSDCPLPQSCYNGRCVDECREDRDCPRADLICERGACVTKEPVQRLCQTGLDCQLNEACRGGVCTEISIIVRDAGATVAPDAAAPGPDAGTSGGPDAGATGLPYGAVCTRASECQSMSCLGPQGAASGRCTRTCVADGECFYPDRCVDVPGAGKYCGQTTALKGVGEQCPSGPNECASGLCLTTSIGPICTVQCAPLPICPAGLACTPVADGSGGAVSVCSPGNGRGFGDTCARGSECASGLCLGVGSPATGVCTTLCDQVPCPTGWSCTAVSDGAGGQVAICAPAGAVGGNAGAACASATECTSGLCLSDARTGGAFCTIPCASAQDCAQISGTTCVLLASGEQVCGPP